MQQRLMTVSTVDRDNGLGVHFDFDKGRGRTEENRNESAKIRRGNGYTYSEGFKRNIVMQFYSRPDGMLIKDFAKSVGVNRDSLLAWRGKYKPEDPFGFRAKQTAMQTSIASDKSNAKELVEKPVEKSPILLRYKGLEFSCSDLEGLSLVIRALKMEGATA